jgi:hypothetical protein
MIAAILAAAVCHIGGQAPFLRPDDDCTPGAFKNLTRAQACVHKQRPPLPAAERRFIVASYGVPKWSGQNGELDHRVPFALGGTTDRANIWPEAGSIPNTKDRLEDYIHARVCDKRTMRLQTARTIFLGDWVAAYRKYHLTS